VVTFPLVLGLPPEPPPDLPLAIVGAPYFFGDAGLGFGVVKFGRGDEGGIGDERCSSGFAGFVSGFLSLMRITSLVSPVQVRASVPAVGSARHGPAHPAAQVASVVVLGAASALGAMDAVPLPSRAHGALMTVGCVAAPASTFTVTFTGSVPFGVVLLGLATTVSKRNSTPAISVANPIHFSLGKTVE
jgi:hypothetical protein